MDSFESRLENLREKHNLKKNEISKRLGFSPNVYGAYERGERRPSFETIIKLADMFDVSIDYLIRGTSPNRPTKQEGFDSKINNILEKYDISDVSFLDINKWEKLSKADIDEINRHFKWIVARSDQSRKE